MLKRAWIILVFALLLICGLPLFLWTINPLLILAPFGIAIILFLLLLIAFIHSAEFTSFEDWDLLIRSVLFRLGFQVQPPKSLMHEHDLSDPEHWEHHHHHEDEE